MKKVLSLVLVLSMILGSFGMAFAATPSDVAGTSYEDAVNVLTELGVVEGYKDGTYKPGNIVTRAEMATLIVKAMGLNDYAVGKSTYTDMNGHWADAYVAYATSLGVLSGYADGTFRPNQTVTYDQAITMLVQALGYKGEFMVGGYPGAYVAQAKTLGILDGIKSGASGANRGDIAVMLFNALPARFVRYDRDGLMQEVAYNTSSKGEEPVYDRLLRRLGVDVTTKFEVITDGDADTALTNIRPYIGASVKSYKDKDGDIIAISEVQSVFLTGDFDGDTFTADDVEYTLTDEAENRKYKQDNEDKTTKDAVTFINGEKDNSLAFDEDDTYTIAAKVTGKTIKEIYSITRWDVTNDFKFETADADDIKEDAELRDAKFYKDDDREIDTNRFELIGVNSLDDIKKDDIVYVYTGKNKEKDGYITRIAVGTETVSGKVSRKNSSGSKVTINGTVYERADDELCQVSKDSMPDTGDEVKLILDAYGDIYDVDKISGTDDYAIVLETGEGETGLSGRDAKIKLFLADGSAKTFVIDSEITNDDVDYTYESGDDILFDAGLVPGTIVQYHIDKNGDIDDIMYPENKKDVNVAKTVTAKGTFDGRVIQSTAVIFTYDGNTADGHDDWKDDDNYSVGTYDSILDSNEVTGSYALDEKEISCVLLKGFSSSDDVYGMFNGWASVDGDYDYEVTVLVDGASKDYNANKDGKDKADQNGGSDAAIHKLIFDASGAVKGATPVKDDAEEDIKVVSLDVTESKVDGRHITINGEEYTVASDVVVYTWSNEDEEWTVGRTRDMRDLNAGSKVVFYSINGDDLDIFDIVTVVKAEEE